MSGSPPFPLPFRRGFFFSLNGITWTLFPSPTVRRIPRPRLCFPRARGRFSPFFPPFTAQRRVSKRFFTRFPGQAPPLPPFLFPPLVPRNRPISFSFFEAARRAFPLTNTRRARLSSEQDSALPPPPPPSVLRKTFPFFFFLGSTGHFFPPRRLRLTSHVKNAPTKVKPLFFCPVIRTADGLFAFCFLSLFFPLPA